MSDDALRARILARRAALIAAVSAVASTECTKPQPCLSIAPVLDDGGVPMPCLSTPPMPHDAGATMTVDEAGTLHLPPMQLGGDAAPPPPMPCLSVVAPKSPPAPPPRPCLTTTAPPPPPPSPKPRACLDFGPGQ